MTTNITNQPENIDTQFIRKSENDFNTDAENLTTTVASISTREIQMIDSIANDLYTKVDIDEAYRIDAKPYIERPFFAGALNFSALDPRYTLLLAPIKRLPGDIIRSNPSLLQAMKIGSLYRADLVLNISIAGTITHAGKILIAALPPMPKGIINSSKQWINTMLSGPHASLFANEATSVMLTIPWYCNSDLATLDVDTDEVTSLDITPINGNYSDLFFLVQNPLAPSNGSSQNLSIVIEACFKNLDIVVPTPRLVTWVAQSGVKGLKETTSKATKNVVGDFIDSAVNTLFGWIGLHNPNVPIIKERDLIISRNLPNTADAAQFFEKLDPLTDYNRIVKSPIFGSTVDEMSISHITSKKQFLGTFKVSIDDPVGKLYWSRPISPFQGGISNDGKTITCTNNLELMHSLHRAWRGGLELIIESVMNNKQQLKLRVLKLYNPSTLASSSWPSYASIANAPSALMEFTQGGQEHVVSLPYLCRNDLTPCSENLAFEGLFHGMYYIYLAQPLANSDGSPMSVEFNVYMRGDKDLTFYGYVPRNLVQAPFPVDELIPPKPQFKAQVGDAIKVMNAPQSQNNPIAVDNKDQSTSHFERLKPNLDIRPLIRRMYPMQNFSTINMKPLESLTEILPLSQFLGEVPYSPAADYQTPISIISRMYYSKTVGFKFQIRILINDDSKAGPQSLQLNVMFIPPNFSYNPLTNTVTGCEINPALMDPVPLPNYRTPFPFQDIPVIYDVLTQTYEFTIPDVTFYKFMGGPDKFLTSVQPFDILSTGDFGSLYIRYFNSSASLDIDARRCLYVGLSDESRFGHHCIASPFSIRKFLSPYFDSPGELPTATPPKYMYTGGFL